jgi:lincosamide nucleotidyltransferase A/C/D/E
MRANEVAEVIRALADAGVEVWVEGGWGVDALVGEETRPHKDVDLVVGSDDVEALVGWLEAQAFRLVAGVPAAGLWRDDAGRGVDVRTVDLVKPEWRTGTGTIDGLPVRCLTASAQMALHAGYEPSDKDRHDVGLLHDRFGLSLPVEYR